MSLIVTRNFCFEYW